MNIPERIIERCVEIGVRQKIAQIFACTGLDRRSLLRCRRRRTTERHHFGLPLVMKVFLSQIAQKLALKIKRKIILRLAGGGSFVGKMISDHDP